MFLSIKMLECHEPPADKLLRGGADPRDDFTGLNPAISQIYRSIHPLNQQRLMRLYKSFDYSFTAIVRTILYTLGDCT